MTRRDPDPATILSIRKTIRDCQLCPLHEGKHVPWSGDPFPDIAVLGEAPGQEEARYDEPFVGSSGQLLRHELRKVGIDDKSVAYVNATSCRPPNNRTPTRDEISACRPHMRLQMALLQPRYIITVGVVALESIRGYTRWPDLQLIHGKPFKWHNAPAPCEPVACWPSYHPSAAQRSVKYAKLLADDLAAFVEWRANEDAGSQWPSDCVICGDELHIHNEWFQPLCHRHGQRAGVLFPDEVLAKLTR